MFRIQFSNRVAKQPSSAGSSWGTDRPGGTYRQFEVAGNNPEVCQASCAAETECRAFTFFPKGAGNPSRCELKDRVPTKVRFHSTGKEPTLGGPNVENIVSGIAGLDFF